MDQRLLGKCGFLCSSCPSWLQQQCAGCIKAHTEGDCYTRDCVLSNGLDVCGHCTKFPCDVIQTRERSTVLDRNWMVWKSASGLFDPSGYWQAVIRQDAGALAEYFADDATIRWHNTNESFSVPAFVQVNCSYPGTWQGELLRTHQIGAQWITAAHIWNNEVSCHATSFFQIRDGKISALDEYWGDDGAPPRWRQDLQLSSPIDPIADFVPATLRDLNTIAVLRQTVWRSTYRGIHSDDMIDQFDFSWHNMQDRKKILDPNFYVYLIDFNHEPVGYLIYQLKSETLLLHSLNLIPDAAKRNRTSRTAPHQTVWAQPWNEGISASMQSLESERHGFLPCNGWSAVSGRSG